MLSRNFAHSVGWVFDWRKSQTLSRLHNSISLCQITMLCLLFAHIFGFSKNNIRIKLKTAGKIVSVTKSNTAYLLQHLAHIHLTNMTWMHWEITEYSFPWKGCFYHVITLKTPTDNTASQQGLTLPTQARHFLCSVQSEQRFQCDREQSTLSDENLWSLHLLLLCKCSWNHSTARIVDICQTVKYSQ